MKVTVLQYKLQSDAEKNFSHIETALNEADSDLIVAPELCVSGFQLSDNTAQAEMSDDFVKQIQIQCKRNSKAFCGSFIRSHLEKYYNQAVLVNSNGNIEASYNKKNLISTFNEPFYFSPGKKGGIDKIAGLNIGVGICYDLRFPEVFRTYAKKEVEVMLLLCEWPKERIDQMLTLAKARAIENQCYFIISNVTGKFLDVTFGGNSMVTSPYGEILENLKSKPGQINIELNIKDLKDYRKKFRPLYEYSRGL